MSPIIRRKSFFNFSLYSLFFSLYAGNETMHCICFRYARFLQQTRIIRATHAVSRQFVSPWRTLAFRSVGYVSVASRGCDECNREPHRAVAVVQELTLAKPRLSDVTVTRELSQEIVKNRVSAAEMQRDKSSHLVAPLSNRSSHDCWWSQLMTSRINDCRNRECIIKSCNDHTFDIRYN